MRTPERRRRGTLARAVAFLVILSMMGVQTTVLTGCAGGGLASGLGRVVGALGRGVAAVGRGLGNVVRGALQNGPALAGAIVGTVAAAQTGNPAAIVQSVGNITAATGTRIGGIATNVLNTVAGGLAAGGVTGQTQQTQQVAQKEYIGRVSDDGAVVGQ